MFFVDNNIPIKNGVLKVFQRSLFGIIFVAAARAVHAGSPALVKPVGDGIIYVSKE